QLSCSGSIPFSEECETPVPFPNMPALNSGKRAVFDYLFLIHDSPSFLCVELREGEITKTWLQVSRTNPVERTGETVRRLSPIPGFPVFLVWPKVTEPTNAIVEL